ncbi:MAG TPA: branched-chain amino acid ABC transporter permease [Syntrophales bacterium]|nr:branched-chain amino acid ABC transporter permease [Syntrophales bacterium]HOL58542.1 branched-chain amino acid ABC transporter permease [Syntrophales bacterium]HPO34850.1 branched-chain amino acid ABC transporter permease [Syntrophales bacterium]
MREKKKIIYLALLFFIILLIPQVIKDEYYLHIFVMSGIWIISALSLNLILGYAGQLNLAQGTFFGIGAYATGLLMQKMGLSFWLALPLGCLFTAAIGFITGLPTLRTRGHYFPIATMCLGIAIYYVIARWDDVTGGARGLFGLPRPDPIALPWLGTISFESTVSCYYLVLFFVVVTIVVIQRLISSLAGKRLIAIRGNEDLAQALGINTMRDKVICFTISTFFAGLAGGLFASYMSSLMAENAHFVTSFEMLLNVMIGGVGTIIGPIIGAIFLPLLSEELHFLGGWRLVVYGIILILTIRFLPFGIVGGIRLAMAKRTGGKGF